MKITNHTIGDKRPSSISSKVAALILTLLIASTIFCPLALGQQGGKGDRDGQNSSREDQEREREKEREKERQREKERDREKDREREKWRRDFDLKGFLKKLDLDKSGTVETNELTSGRTKRFLSDMGINTNNPIQIDETLKRLKTKSADKRDKARKSFEDKVRPRLNSFGADPDTFGVAGFGASEKSSPEVTSFDERLTGLKGADFDEAVLKDAKSIVATYDRDESGFLEGDEIKRIRWQSPSPDENDINRDGRLSLFELAKRIQDRTDKKSKEQSRGDRDQEKDQDDSDRLRRYSGSRSYFSGRSSGSRSSSPSKGSKSTQDSRESSSDTSSGNSKSKVDYQSYVDGLFKKYDQDKDSKLSVQELKAMRRPLKGDYDKDGFVTKFEAAKYLTDAATARSAGKSSSRSDSSSPSPNRSSNRTGGSSRSSSGSSRPRGTLSSLDTNGDGQIQMSEFSKQWDEDTLQSFRKSDVDQNGILSAEEWKTKSD